jgi:translation elongation factor EF-G
LKLTGVEELLEVLDRYAPQPEYNGEFAAKVYKISRDPQGNRLTWLKVTGGSLKVRSNLRYANQKGEEREEKLVQLRLYSAEKFTAPEEIFAGQLAAVTGLTETFAGQALGAEKSGTDYALEPVMTYRVNLPKGADPALVVPKLRLLEEEDPQLHLLMEGGQIHVQIMGRVQQEVFRSLVKQRFDLDVTLDDQRIFYKETIADTVEGVGHFEPLRHYAECHLLLEPLTQGSGLVFDTTDERTAKDNGIYSSSRTYEPVSVSWGETYSDIKMGGSSIIGGFGLTLWQMRAFEKGVGIFYSPLGYSYSGSGSSIPGYAPLIFEIEVVKKP